MTPKENVVPPGGFHFMEGDVRIDGHSYQSVADNLMRYRLDNKLPVGNPLKEVLDAVCARHPHFCDGNNPPVKGANPSLAGRIAAWMAQVYRDARGTVVEANFVPEAEAERRASICRDCVYNEDWTGQGCASCLTAAKRLGYTFRAGRQVRNGDDLRGCAILGQENPTAVWLKAPPVPTPQQLEGLPAHCWRKQ